jgi:hypothetical protein
VRASAVLIGTVRDRGGCEARLNPAQIVFVGLPRSWSQHPLASPR